MTDAELYEQLRPSAFAIAYRMLGSVSEAEDLVQEGLLRLHRALDEGERIESPRAWLRFGGFSLRPVEVNGQPGAIALDPDGKVISVLALDIAEGQVQAVRSVVNPEKLGHLGPVADTGSVLRGRR